MNKPHIKKLRSTGYAVFECKSKERLAAFTRTKFGHGITPADAYKDWEGKAVSFVDLA